MCGIGGIAGAGATDIGALERIAGAMRHRGPDGEGLWCGDRLGLAFRRLAIIDLHERSNQPLHFEHLHLVFNGEIYNYLELRDELGRLGHRFVTEGDAEVLLHAWAQWGSSALHRFNGMFAFAVWDDASSELTLAVDRFAEKPLFFHHSLGRLMFASDVRALRAADPSVGRADEDAVARFLSFGWIPDLPATFFEDVRRLPPAHLLRWAPEDVVRVERWWEPQSVDVPRDPIVAAARLRELLSDAVALRLRSDVPVGTSLSGGIDSSTVISIASQLAGGHRRHAFTATFPDFERDEWGYAEAVARSAGVAAHHAVRPELDELLADLPALVADQEEPFGSTSIYAQWRVMRAARDAGVIVLLDGQGADELFGGYRGIEGWVIRELGLRETVGCVLRDRALAGPIAIAYASGRAPRSVARLHRLRVASPYVARATAREAAHYAPRELDWAVGAPPSVRERLRQTFQTSLPQLCRYADRDSMASGVEIRLPFLDPRVAEFALSLPPELVWSGGFTKRVLRDAMRGLVPDEVLDRRDKVGFETPEHQWFGSEAGRDLVAETLLDETADAHVVRAEIERDLAHGAWRDTAAIWRAVNVRLWRAAVRGPVTASPPPLR